MRKVNETFPDISNNRGYITSAPHTKRLYLQKQPLAQVLFLGPIRENQVKLMGALSLEVISQEEVAGSGAENLSHVCWKVRG